MGILRLYDANAHDFAEQQGVLKRLQQYLGADLVSVRMERCHYLEYSQQLQHELPLETLLHWLIKKPLQHKAKLLQNTLLGAISPTQVLLEIGPRFNFCTPYSTNCVNIFHNLGYTEVQRVESSTLYLLTFVQAKQNRDLSCCVELLCDRMTHCQYTTQNVPRGSFDEQLPKQQEPWHFVPLLEEGPQALERVNKELGLAFSDDDFIYYNELFARTLKRNPTTVELFDCAQSNSEHSRHWFFRGRMIIDGVEQPQSLIRMIMNTQNHTNPNNTIKFSDNSSAICGFEYVDLKPVECASPGPVRCQIINSDLIFTAETHNMPTAVAPFSGATTGTGGRLRDVQGVGRGGVPIAGTAGYCVGVLQIPGYQQDYEPCGFKYPSTFASPLQVLIEASNGASDYGNKFGEPVITGFAISYGLNNVSQPGTRDEFVKPIMFSGGLGTMPATMRDKLDPTRGMLLAKIGGPVYRIGVGGGAASSVEVQGSCDAELDFNAVQRGDAEMENKLNRVVRACLDLGDHNPILAIHDQGAGGNGNVLKELVEPGLAGAIVFSKEFQLGDPTITALELWGAEYQENNAIICKPEQRKILERICARERCPISFVGVVSGDGRVTLVEAAANFETALDPKMREQLGSTPFDLELKHVLGDMPPRTYNLKRQSVQLKPLQLSSNLQIDDALERVLSLVAVGSKRFLTNKVDRCVGGLIVQQQCVGPLQAPLADYGLTTVSHFSKCGIATSIGTQPLKGLLDPAAMARMCVAEALSNLVFVKISELPDIKCSGNWMWAAKMPFEGAKMYDACRELCQIMKELHIAIDGGKDSLSMASKVDGETVKSPGTLVISTYAPCPNVHVRVTPDLKGPATGCRTALLWINIENKFRLGGSSLAQAYAQQGSECPNLVRSEILAQAFTVTQTLLQERLLHSGHDISDGGLLICLLEMAIGGLCGLNVNLSEIISTLKDLDAVAISIKKPEVALLFAEECGWVVEVDESNLATVRGMYNDAGVPNFYLGIAECYGLDADVHIKNGEQTILKKTLRDLYKQWERTSYELEKLQSNKSCASAEYNCLDYRQGPQYKWELNLQSELKLAKAVAPIRVAVLREEGVNSEREMIASLVKSGFEVHDVTMSDLLAERTILDNYRGLIFPGGFSYADTLGSAKGWAANILCSNLLRPQFEAFKRRQDVFSLGICNGCQLMTLIGFVGNETIKNNLEGSRIFSTEVALLQNRSQRFECRWSTVRIPPSKSIMLRNMHNMVLGCWVAHGEGRFAFQNSQLMQQLKMQQLVALEYVDDLGVPTELYPMNPNGSPEGIAGLCSADGRHLALMPHPERCSAMYQWPYVPHDFPVKPSNEESPWQLMFNNGFNWCAQNKN